MRRLILLAIWFAAILPLAGCADNLILHPTTQPASAGAAMSRQIHDHGRIIEVFTARSPGAQRTGDVSVYALEFTGNATRAEHVADYIAHRWGDRPVEAWVMNYPGYGQSTGPAKLDAIAPAALVAYDEIARQAQGKPIVVAGSSLGTAAALYVAANRPAAAIILQNPPPLQRMILQKYGWIVPAPVVAQIPSELDSLANARRVKIPAVFVLAGRDQTVAPQYQQMVVDAYAGEKHLVHMPDADHGSPIVGDAARQYQNELDWIWSRIEK